MSAKICLLMNCPDCTARRANGQTGYCKTCRNKWEQGYRRTVRNKLQQRMDAIRRETGEHVLRRICSMLEASGYREAANVARRVAID